MAPVICDLGHGYCKVGFAGDKFPRLYFSTTGEGAILPTLNTKNRTGVPGLHIHPSLRNSPEPFRGVINRNSGMSSMIGITSSNRGGEMGYNNSLGGNSLGGNGNDMKNMNSMSKMNSINSMDNSLGSRNSTNSIGNRNSSVVKMYDVHMTNCSTITPLLEWNLNYIDPEFVDSLKRATPTSMRGSTTPGTKKRNITPGTGVTPGNGGDVNNGDPNSDALNSNTPLELKYTPGGERHKISSDTSAWDSTSKADHSHELVDAGFNGMDVEGRDLDDGSQHGTKNVGSSGNRNVESGGSSENINVQTDGENINDNNIRSFLLPNGQLDLEALFDHIYTGLAIDPSEHSMFLTEPAQTLLSNREDATELLFERYSVPSVAIANAGVLALCGEGMKTGLVLESGEKCTYIVPVYEGYVESHLMERVNLGGEHVTTQLGKIIQSRLSPGSAEFGGSGGGYGYMSGAGGSSSSSAMPGWHCLREMKEKFGYIAYDQEKEMFASRDTTCFERIFDNRLSGKPIRLQGVERWLAPEILFQPNLWNALQFDTGFLKNHGIHALLYETVMRAPIDLRRVYFNSVLLSGGNTLFPGFKTRLEKELKALYLKESTKNNKTLGREMRFLIEDNPRRMLLPFMGGSHLAETACKAYGGKDVVGTGKESAGMGGNDDGDRGDSDKCDSIWFTQSDYEEYGLQGIHDWVIGEPARNKK